MMWNILLLLISVSAASADETPNNGCHKMVGDNCGTLAPTSVMPSNSEELEQLCTTALAFFDCTDNVLRTCKDDEHTREQMEKFSFMTRYICNLDALVLDALARTLPCIHRNFWEISHCENMDKDSIAIISEIMNKHNQAIITTEPNECLKTLYIIGCGASKVGYYCDDLGKDVILEIASGLDEPYEKCSPGMKEKLPAITKALLTELELQNTNSREEEERNKK